MPQWARTSAGGAFADVDVADDRGRRDPPKSHSQHVVQVRDRNRIGVVEDPSGVEERGDLDVDVCRERIHREHVLPRFEVGREGVAVVEARGAIAPQVCEPPMTL
jgi:hypothetical protein